MQGVFVVHALQGVFVVLRIQPKRLQLAREAPSASVHVLLGASASAPPWCRGAPRPSPVDGVPPAISTPLTRSRECASSAGGQTKKMMTLRVYQMTLAAGQHASMAVGMPYPGGPAHPPADLDQG